MVYYGHFKCNRRRIADYPNLSGYLRDLFQMPGVKETVDFEHIKQHYYYSHDRINPTRIVPLGPLLILDAPHDRDRFRGTGIPAALSRAYQSAEGGFAAEHLADARERRRRGAFRRGGEREERAGDDLAVRRASAPPRSSHSRHTNSATWSRAVRHARSGRSRKAAAGR